MQRKWSLPFFDLIAKWNSDKKMRWVISLLICLLSVFIFIITTSSYFVFMIRQSKEMAEDQLSLLAANYEITLESYRNIAMALIMDDAIQEYAKMEKITAATHFSNVTNAQKTLNNVTNIMLNMNFIAVVSDQSGQFLYKGDISWLDTKFKDLYRQDYESSDYAARTGSLRMSYNDTYLVDGKKTLNIYFPIYSLTYINKEIGLLCMNFNDNFLESFSYNYIDNKSELMIVDNYGESISTSSEGGEMNRFAWRDLMTGNRGAFTKDNMLYNYQKIGRWNFYLVNEMPLVDFYLNGLILLPILIIIVLAVIIASLRVGNRVIRRIYRPLEIILIEMNEVATGRLDVRITAENIGEDFNKLANGFNYMMDKIDDLMHKIQQEQHQKEQLRFNALQSQIQPHFLYNTLECIHWQAAADRNQKISTLVMALAQYYRICLSRGKDIICLKEEMEHTRNYLIIQNMRYDNIIEYDVIVEERFLDFPIPKLTLQPLIENSIYHGIKNKAIQKGKVTICADESEDMLVISVSDNGMGMTEEKIKQLNAGISCFQDGEGYGVHNVNKRIELLFGPQYGLRYKRNESGGITVEVYLPKG